jgi:hypothetical protein
MRLRSVVITSAAAIFVLTIVCPAPATAQEIKAGFSSATINFLPGNDSRDLESIASTYGFVGGVSFLIPTGRIGGFQVEGLFHQKGAQNLLRLDDKLRLTYLEVPVLLHIDVYQRDPRAVYVIAGPALAFNIQASYESDGEREDVMDGIEDLDVGLVFGGGVELRRITIEGRYTFGLRSAFRDGDLDGAFKNRTLSLLVGFRFRR